MTTPPPTPVPRVCLLYTSCDGFDYAPYVEKGIFADLSGVLNKDDFKENLVDSYFTDAGTFILPMRCV